MIKFKNKAVKNIFDNYPNGIREKMLLLRELVFETASEIEDTGEIEETLKWGEPSYIVKGGSTVRMDWKSKNPTQYAMYFNCNTKLVDTFKETYKGKFKYEGNRAIVFDVKEKVPVKELKHCIELSLTYHSRKSLPMLGV